MAHVLIDDARAGGVARLYRDPVGILVANEAGEIPAALDRLQAALDSGLHAAGFLAYEAGAGFGPRWPQAQAADWPLLWFGLFEAPAAFDPATLPDPVGATIGTLRPLVDQAWHAAAVAHVLDLIAAGDIYQANLTFPCEVDWAGDVQALYARIRAASGAGFGGIVDLGDRALLSASPELFFALADGRVIARPMKGTAPRSGDAAIDARRAEALRASAKERAENLMITDLIRNDLSRVAVPGSVETPALFTVESYPTVLQMTSTVEARLAAGKGAIDLLRAAFPCGSVTGAPKLRAAEVIAEIETGPRGAYTGAIGWMSREAACFNVAIRTLAVVPGEPARLGIGSGIVADSDPAAEWAECLAKAAFLHGARA
jgi:aminodeoxychorismate synthase component I